MDRAAVVSRYYEWLYGFVADDSYNRLLTHLYSREFFCLLERDTNRAADGINLRQKFANECRIVDVRSYLDQPCNMLEMMVALAKRCEDQVMFDPEYGDRTSVWFWTMIVNLGLGGMTDENYDPDLVDRVLDIFMNRAYDYDGTGGLFAVENPPEDLRTMEIWYQMHLYLNKYAE